MNTGNPYLPPPPVEAWGLEDEKDEVPENPVTELVPPTTSSPTSFQQTWAEPRPKLTLEQRFKKALKSTRGVTRGVS